LYNSIAVTRTPFIRKTKTPSVLMSVPEQLKWHKCSISAYTASFPLYKTADTFIQSVASYNSWTYVQRLAARNKHGKRKRLPWPRPGRPGYHSGYSDLFRDGLSGDRIRGGGGGGDLPNLSRPALRPSQPSAERVPGYSWLSSGQGMALTTAPSSVEVEETAELYLYSPFVRTWQGTGWNLPVPVPLPTRQYPNHTVCMTVCSLKQTSYVTIYPALKAWVVRPKFDAKPFYR
jgi:hypothetical protein